MQRSRRWPSDVAIKSVIEKEKKKVQCQKTPYRESVCVWRMSVAYVYETKKKNMSVEKEKSNARKGHDIKEAYVYGHKIW